MSSASRSDSFWSTAPAPGVPPAPDEVVVWRVALDAVRCGDEHELSDDERARAERFKFPHVRRAFIQGRLFLRRVLAATVGSSPAALRFTAEGNGKPALIGNPLAFNLSHSAGEALLAVAGTGPVGVDIEAVNPNRDLLGMARRFFAAAEYEELIRFPEAERAAGFYRCWTRKEAFIKALGEGLSHPLDAFVVRFDEAAPAEFASPKERAEGWRLFNLELGERFAGAVVGPALVQRTSCFMLHDV